MSNVHENELVVSEGKKSRFENILAGVFYTIFSLLVLSVLYNVLIDESSWIFIQSIYAPLTAALFCLALALNYSIAKTRLIDLKKNKLISRYSIGPFMQDQLSEVPKLEYVAVFKNPEHFYEVNLWFNGNKHYRMDHFDKETDAFSFARNVANKLNLRLLDASVKGSHKWIETA